MEADPDLLEYPSQQVAPPDRDDGENGPDQQIVGEACLQPEHREYQYLRRHGDA